MYTHTIKKIKILSVLCTIHRICLYLFQITIRMIKIAVSAHSEFRRRFWEGNVVYTDVRDNYKVESQ